MMDIRTVREQMEIFLSQTSDIKSFGSYLESVSMYPVFLSVHCILVALALRTRHIESQEFTRQHPLPSLFVCLASCYGGTIMQNFLLSKPIIDALRNEQMLFLGSISWYLVFFCPGDIFWKLSQLKLLRAILLVLKEVHRLRMITIGVKVASGLYPDNWMIIIIIGAVRGSGAKFIMKPLFHFVKGDMLVCSELLKPHFATRSSVIISALLWNEYAGFINVPFTREALLVFAFAYLAIFQVLFLVQDSVKDPYSVIQVPICYVLFTLPAELFSDVKMKAKRE